MENASKALIIAGAILISIVLITFGVMILGQGSEVIKTSDMSETEVATFNEKFTQYEGTSVRGSRVNALFNTVKQSNLANADKQVKVTVTGTLNGANATNKTITTTNSNRVSTGEVYDVTCGYDNNTGLVNQITIKKK